MTIERIVLDAVKSAKNDEIKATQTNAGRERLTKERNCGPVDQIGIINARSKNRRLNIMVVGAALGLIACLLMLTSYKGNLSGEAVGIISTISGIFGACLKDAYSFEFGSSRGSKDKDEKISSAILEKLNN
ncbi:MAG: hypothetical protein LBJ45_00180 [Holosporaceae bacterium]|jgi:hypothetical protein|nr:hypothetical protein [Holosporaceae bacterium]